MSLSNMLIDSRYPLDKVIFLASGSTSLGSYFSAASVNVPHGLTFTPLPRMVWSTTPDFSVCYEAGSGPAPQSVLRWNLGITGDLYANSTNIRLDFTNFISTSYTIYYRVFCFAPSDITIDIDSTSSLADNFILNSQQNYLKLLSSGKIALTSNTVTVDHNLGYIPQVDAWTEATTGEIYPPQSNGSTLYPGFGTTGYVVTTTQLIFYGYSSRSFGHYRIYIDKAYND